jgi:hypothetical protein
MKSRIRPAQPAGRAAEEWLNPQRGTPPAERLSVYAGGYLARTREALAEVYEAVRFVLGESAFTELSHAYAARHPSHDSNLSFAGRHLPEFLPDFPLTQRLPFLPDLARLEWLVCQAFHAFDQPPLDSARLGGLPPESWGRLRLTFQPSVAVVASAWPILDIWAARRQPRDSVRLEVAGRPQRVLVRRRSWEVRCDRLTELEHRLLESLLAGRALGEALSAADGRDAAAVQRAFARWMGEGLIVGAEPTGAVGGR